MQVETPTRHLYPVFVRHGRSRRTAKAGFISADGQVAIPPIFDSVDWFFDGRAAACLDGKWGFIDETGTWVVEPQYVSQVRFSEGLAVCLVDAKKRIYAVIDISGNRLFELNHYLVANFSEGLAWIRTRDEKSAFVNREGRMVTDFPFGPVGDFRQGLAPVFLESKYGFIDPSGQGVIAAKYDKAYASGSQQFRGVVEVRGRKGVVDRGGNWVLHPQFQTGMPFREGLAWFQCPDGTSALFDEDGEVRAELGLEIARMGVFAEGLCNAQPVRDPLALLGYVDRSGKWVIPPSFVPAGMFRGGLALVEDATGFGYVNRIGSRVWWSTDLNIMLPFHLHQSWIC